MKFVDVFWTEVVNKAKVVCDCGHFFTARMDRWKVKCLSCGKVENITGLRERFAKEIKDDDSPS